VSAPAAQLPSLDRWEARLFPGGDALPLPYRLLRPQAAAPERGYPLVLFLHGMGERGSDNTVQLGLGVSELFASDGATQQFPAVVLAPQCPKGDDSHTCTWRNRGDADKPLITTPLRLALDAVEAACQEFAVDRDRLYIGGLSMGGFGTWNAIQEHPGLFAAAFPICGGGDTPKAERLAELPLWVFHGAKDEVVPPQLSRDMVWAIQEAGGSPGYCEYPDVGHDSWTNAFEEPRLLPWLFAQIRSTP
jgi:predicted peptidase